MKILGYIIYPPICLITLGLIYWGFGWLAYWLFSQGFLFWFIVLSLFFAFIYYIWKLFRGISNILLGIISFTSPDSKYNFWWVFGIGIINAAYAIYKGWKVDMTWVAFIVYILLVVLLTGAVIGAAGAIVDKTREKEKKLQPVTGEYYKQM